MPELRVLVVADNLLARAGLAALLGDSESINLVGQVAGSESLASDIDIYRPGLLIWDFGWQPDEARAAFSALIDEAGADDMLPVLALLPDERLAADVAALLNLLPAGGLLLRETDSDQLVAALLALAMDLFVFDPLLHILPAQEAVPEPLAEPLTPRELEVLQLLAEGLANKMIARQLDISDHTVKFHVNAILTKLNAQSRTEAVVRATRLGLIIL
jgi:DNA-binding NarL/FixJ family response regulator